MVMAEVSSIEAVTGDGPSGAFRAFWESTLLADGGAAMVIYLSGRFDYTTYRQFTEVLGQAWQTAQAAGVTELVLDLGHVSYMDSSALGMMLVLGSTPLSAGAMAASFPTVLAARYGLGIDDINQVVQAAIGGREAGRLYEPGGDRNFPVMVRLDAPYRSSLDAIGRIPVGGPRGATLADVSEIKLVSGVSYIYREDGSRYVPIRFSVRGRDLGSFVADAREKIADQVKLPAGSFVEWGGQYENLQAASRRLYGARVSLVVSFVAILIAVDVHGLDGDVMRLGVHARPVRAAPPTGSPAGGACARQVAS